MKFLIVFLVASMTSFANADVSLVCKTALNKTPVDTFVIKHVDGRGGSISFSRQQRFDSTPGPLKLIPGCEEGSRSEHEILDLREIKQSVYVECAGDGDAGFAKINMDGSIIRGKISFPNGNIGYVDNTTLEVSCSSRK
jgi:hypothetical protein